MRRRRVLLSIAVAAAGVVLLAAGVALAGIGSGVVPGKTTNTDNIVGATFFDAQGNSITVQAVAGRLSFRTPGAVTTEVTTMVTVDAFTPSGVFGSGCWTVATTPFSIRGDNTASLSFDSTAPGVAPCPGQLVSPGFLVPVNVTPIATDLGVNGAVILSATWTPNGVPSERRTSLNTSCQSFRALDVQDWVQQNSHATASIASFTIEGADPSSGDIVTVPLAGTYTTNFATVTTMTDSQTVIGPATGTCGPFGNP